MHSNHLASVGEQTLAAEFSWRIMLSTWIASELRVLDALGKARTKGVDELMAVADTAEDCQCRLNDMLGELLVGFDEEGLNRRELAS